MLLKKKIESMNYKIIKEYIENLIFEDFGNERNFSDGRNNSLYATSDGGNIEYDTKIYKYYEISDWSDYNKKRDRETYYTTFKIKDEYKNKVNKNEISFTIKTVNDISNHEIKKKNKINSLYRKLKI